MEENKEERVNELTLLRFDAVSKFKSVKRAWRRGHISIYGFIYPKRPFKNISTKVKKNGRVHDKHTLTFNKKRIYEQFTGIGRRVC